MPKRFPLVASLLLATLLATVGARVPAAAAEPTVAAYATGYTVAAPFRAFFDANGGVEIFGLPLSDALDENGRAVQYFERSRFEWHPDAAGTDAEIMLARLGADLTADRGFAPVPPVQALGLPLTFYFDQTGHTLRGAFKAYWQAHDGLRLFGYPVSEELLERDPDDGQTYTAQYFERARMEWHPASDRVELGRLGAQAFAQTYAARQPKPATLPAAPAVPLVAPPVAVPAAPAAAPATPALDGYEQQVLATLLGARRAAGVATPQLDAQITELARQRSADMATRNYFSHYTPENTTIFTLLGNSGMPWSFAGETIARNNYANNQTAGVAAQALLDSPPHRAVILDPQYGYVGIGHAYDGRGMHYYTVVWVRR
jgi:uncharacterized protein YkwD